MISIFTGHCHTNVCIIYINFTGHQFGQSSCLAIYSGVQVHSQGGLGEGRLTLFSKLVVYFLSLNKAQRIIEIKSTWVGPWSTVIFAIIVC